MKVDDQRAAEIQKFCDLAFDDTLYKEHVSDLLSDRAELLHELAVRDRAMDILARNMLGNTCPDGTCRALPLARCKETGWSCVECYIADAKRKASAGLAEVTRCQR